MVVRKVGQYETGRTIGEGTFTNKETGESVAMKVLNCSTIIIKHKMINQASVKFPIFPTRDNPFVSGQKRCNLGKRDLFAL
ncbi:hypothetical protein QN277_020031 [Acacia crassicarpa]|uniref:Non-specific serine/threonine protein kinase n=1 Tax=Acacia crassicarpa TaxID=499986 RepID=A0AAE1JIX7_9FABA|nr:hypothetical protein QN277_020031 [Acacia crassicarpa]